MKIEWVPKRLSGKRRRLLEALRNGASPLDQHDGLYDLALVHQVASPLASLAAARGEPLPARWRERLQQVRAQNLIFELHLKELTQILDGLEVPWFVTRGAARLADPLIPDRNCGDIDLYVLPSDWPQIEAALSALPDFERDVQRGEKNRSTRHFNWRPSAVLALDFHLGISPFHSEGGDQFEVLMQRRIRNGAGVWVLSPEDDYGMALIEALIEAPANRLRRLWELELLLARLSEGERQRMRRRFGLRRWAHRLPEQVFTRLQGTTSMQKREQLLVRYSGLSLLILASRRPLRQTRDSIGLMLRRFRT